MKQSFQEHADAVDEFDVDITELASSGAQEAYNDAVQRSGAVVLQGDSIVRVRVEGVSIIGKVTPGKNSKAHLGTKIPFR